MNIEKIYNIFMDEFYETMSKANAEYHKSLDESKIIESQPIIIDIQDYYKYNHDYKLIFNLLNELTDTPILKHQTYLEIINNLTSQHKIFVCIKNDNNISTPIGIITLLIEQKLIHGGSKIAHIEDLVVEKNFRRLKIGTKLLRHCIDYARDRGCYKVILDCSESLENYYQFNHFHKSGIQMRMNI